MNQTLIQLAEQSAIKLTQPEKNLVAKLQNEYNVQTNGLPLAHALAAFVRACVTGFGPVKFRGKSMPVSIFDRSRYLILKLDRDLYSSYID